MSGTRGQPTKIDRVLRRDGAGNEVTVADHIIQAIGAGNYIEQAAASAGVHKSTVYNWQKAGARIAADIEAGRRTLPRAGSQDRQMLEFFDAVAEAESQWEVASNAALERLSRPRTVEETRTTSEWDPVQAVMIDTKKITVRKVEEADSATIRWRLERKFPTRYGRQVDVTGLIGVGAIPESVREQAEKVLGAAATRLAENVAARVEASEPEAEPQT